MDRTLPGIIKVDFCDNCDLKDQSDLMVTRSIPISGNDRPNPNTTDVFVEKIQSLKVYVT